MSKRKSQFRLSAVLMLVAVIAIAPAWAAPAAISIENAWARPGIATAAPAGGAMQSSAAPMKGGNSAVYFILKNAGTTEDRLIAASSPVATKSELHISRIENGVASMRAVPDIAVPAGGSTELKPGGLHVMLVGLKQDLKVGDRIPLELRFARAGVMQLTVEVKMMKQ
ncbi:MAG: copper chaperone PCu(A)C [Armatimonadetes bacterium]|nr:copper chaperone PCu(A)C [Armatimonadota bacterium]